MNTNNEDNKLDTGLYCLMTVASYYSISADANQIIHSMNLQGEVMDDKQIILAGKRLNLKTKLSKVHIDSLKKITLPAIVKTGENKYTLLVKVIDDKYLILKAFENSPKVVDKETFMSMWTNELFLFVPRNLEGKEGKFGFKWFIPSIIKFKKPLVQVLIAAFVMQILALMSPLITQNVIDKVLVNQSLSTLDVLVIALLIITIFETLLSISRNYIFTHTSSKIDVILSSKLFDHLFKLPLNYFESRRVGDTVARVRELENIRRFLTGVPMSAVLDCLFIVVYIVVMFFYSSKLTYITLAMIPVLALISIVITPLLKNLIDEKFKFGAESQSYLVEAVTGVQTIKSFSIEPSIQKKWETTLADYTKAGFKTSILSGNASAIAQLVQKICDLLILWFGATLAINGELTIGSLVAFRMLSGRVSSPVLRLVQVWQDFQQTSISIQRIGDIFNSRKEPSMDSSKTRLPNIDGNIEFNKVVFRYKPTSSEVIRNMTFKIEPNTVVGIVGRSGSGKSTISKLVQRLYIPESGKISIDGIDLALADPVWLRKQIGVVLQENFLFNKTVRENIALQNPAARMDEIIRVAKIAGAHDFIVELSEGYDTMVGEKGIGLSGGQKQRVAIARALLSNPKILIFDEATSALDYESESIIQKNLKEICKGRTVMIIAHRLSTLKDADKIMVVEKGEVVEYDNKDKLIENKGLYYHLLKQQEL